MFAFFYCLEESARQFALSFTLFLNTIDVTELGLEEKASDQSKEATDPPDFISSPKEKSASSPISDLKNKAGFFVQAFENKVLDVLENPEGKITTEKQKDILSSFLKSKEGMHGVACYACMAFNGGAV